MRDWQTNTTPRSRRKLVLAALQAAFNGRYRSAALAGTVGVAIAAGIGIWFTPFLADATRHPASSDVVLDTTSPLSDAQISESFAAAGYLPAEDVADPSLTTASPPAETWRDISIKSGDTLSSLLGPMLDSPAELHAMLHVNREAKRLARIRAGETLSVQTDENDRFVALRYVFDNVNALHASRSASGFDVRVEPLPLDRRIERASGIIESSLFASAQAAGISDTTAMNLAQIFGWDIDFALDLRQGDRYTVIYEQSYHDDVAVGPPRILAAEFINGGKTYRALYFRDKTGRGEYYAPDGKLMRKAFFKTPVEFSRISSRFSLGRKHPILNRIRAHRGVDYAAPTGTPVKATADGTIVAIGDRGGYGKTLVLQHGSRYTTLYAHLSRYARGVRSGGRVRQGDVIGYVGQTGLATGPHLHYEFRVDGVHRNPLSVTVAVNETIPATEKAEFHESARALLAQLDIASSQAVALNATTSSGEQEKRTP